MKTFDNQQIIELMREEWTKKVQTLLEAVDLQLTSKVGDKEVEVMKNAKGLSVKHIKTGKIYSVVEAGPAFVKLSLASGGESRGEELVVNAQELEKNYELA